ALVANRDERVRDDGVRVRTRRRFERLEYQLGCFVQPPFGRQQEDQRGIRARLVWKVADLLAELALRFVVAAEAREDIAAEEVSVFHGGRRALLRSCQDPIVKFE